MKRKRTKALEISVEVKRKVLARDGHCIWCGSPGLPEAHFVPRSRGGLGIEENILTLCRECHFAYDHTLDRPRMGEFFREYLKSKYPDWNEDKLKYKGKHYG